MSLTLEAVLHDSLHSVQCITLLDSNTVIATGTDDGHVILWRFAKNQVYKIELGAPVLCLVSLPTDAGVRMACGLADGWLVTISLCDLDSTPDVTHRVAHSCAINALAYSSKYAFLASAGTTDGITLWKEDQARSRWLREASLCDIDHIESKLIQGLCFIEAEDVLAITSLEGGVCLLALSSGEVLRTIEVPSRASGLCVAPSHAHFFLMLPDGEIQLKGLHDGVLDTSYVLDTHARLLPGRLALLAPNVIVTADKSGSVNVWRLPAKPGTPVPMSTTKPVSDNFVEALSTTYSSDSDGVYLITAASSASVSTIKVWRWNDSKVVGSSGPAEGSTKRLHGDLKPSSPGRARRNPRSTLNKHLVKGDYYRLTTRNILTYGFPVLAGGLIAMVLTGFMMGENLAAQTLIEKGRMVLTRLRRSY
ncbi:WD40 repeat-like protein [Sistotremastrum niveocremeum HHB9708]|uniref:WD40 repeat-like protein n=1 Tax=Sistotremastrum niveocremeum HHB9708 TaxID=1314777 RepID=A0A164Q8E8_9AGAM|nr:WD40 repeat-like protein [Sistotremastrum niveocremeum HHB9708]